MLFIQYLYGTSLNTDIRGPASGLRFGLQDSCSCSGNMQRWWRVSHSSFSFLPSIFLKTRFSFISSLGSLLLDLTTGWYPGRHGNRSLAWGSGEWGGQERGNYRSLRESLVYIFKNAHRRRDGVMWSEFMQHQTHAQHPHYYAFILKCMKALTLNVVLHSNTAVQVLWYGYCDLQYKVICAIYTFACCQKTLPDWVSC